MLACRRTATELEQHDRGARRHVGRLDGLGERGPELEVREVTRRHGETRAFRAEREYERATHAIDRLVVEIAAAVRDETHPTRRERSEVSGERARIGVD